MIQFAKRSSILNHQIFYVVIACREQDKWLFIKRRDEMTWELPRGKREPKEDLIKAARRALFEQTGSRSYWMQEICVYRLSEATSQWGLLMYAEITDRGELTDRQNKEIIAAKPEGIHWTYGTHALLFNKVKQELSS